MQKRSYLNGAHLLQIIRYVHNNPVKTRMVKEPGAYSWRSFREYVNDSS